MANHSFPKSTDFEKKIIVCHCPNGNIFSITTMFKVFVCVLNQLENSSTKYGILAWEMTETTQ